MTELFFWHPESESNEMCQVKTKNCGQWPPCFALILLGQYYKTITCIVHISERMAEIMEEDKVTIKEVKEEIKEEVNEGSTENRGTVRCFIYIH